MAIIVNRIQVTGANSVNFGRDFLVSYERTRIERGEMGSMDSVFQTKNSVPPGFTTHQYFTSNQCAAPIPENPVIQAVGNSNDGDCIILFASLYSPPYEQEQLSAISGAYPHLTFIYDYANINNQGYGRLRISNGNVTVAPAAELESIDSTVDFAGFIHVYKNDHFNSP